MGSLIDSSVIIAAERGMLDLEDRLREYGDEEIAISAITATELLHGIHRAKGTTPRRKREAFVEHVLSNLVIVPFDLVAARMHASVWAELAKSGISVGAHDLLIGATALSIGYGVITRDEPSFPRIPGLEVARW